MADSYGETVNAELLRFIGRLTGTVLDVGCGRGAWAPQLRERGAEMLVGVEPSRDAEVARPRYDLVITQPVERAEIPPADVIIAADVLEHLADPWAALRTLRAAAAESARLFVSVPNAQFVKAVATVARGDFPDEDGGFWDRTHLRWFTTRSLCRTLGETGWAVVRVGFAVGGGIRSCAVSTLPRFGPFLSHQIHVEATNGSGGG